MSSLPPVKPPEERSRQDAHTNVADPRRGLVLAKALLRPLARMSRTTLERVTRTKINSEDINLSKQLVFGVPPILLSFFVFVLAPAFALSIYFFFIASDQYEAEARFAVRSVEVDKRPSSSSSSSSSLADTLYSASNQNAYIVASYIRSRAIVDDIRKTIDLQKMFQNSEADFWARLPKNASADVLTDYWNDRVQPFVDNTSGIVTVHVRAFRPDDALQITQEILAKSELLVNRISETARRDAVRTAENEVNQTFMRVQHALAELRKFRDAQEIIDPGQVTGEINKLLIPLLVEKIRLESEIFVSSKELGAEAPTLRVARNQLASIELKISELRKRLTGVSNLAVSGVLAKYEELDIQRSLAERFYAFAQSDLERARQKAQRQEVFFSVFVKPTKPEYSYYPKRFSFSMLSFIGLLIIWSIAALLVSSIDDHRL